MKKLYRIKWISENGVSGHGLWHEDSEILSVIVKMSNSEYPNIKHWIEEIEDDGSIDELNIKRKNENV